jgi:hypothetical protein
METVLKETCSFACSTSKKSLQALWVFSKYWVALVAWEKADVQTCVESHVGFEIW